MEQPYESPPVRTGYNTALASMITGIVMLLLSCIPFAGILLGIIPIVLGLMATKTMRRTGEDDSGRTLAVVGIILGSLTILFGIGSGLWFALIVRSFMPHVPSMPHGYQYQ
jgi:hypothetical protein